MNGGPPLELNIIKDNRLSISVISDSKNIRRMPSDEPTTIFLDSLIEFLLIVEIEFTVD